MANSTTYTAKWGIMATGGIAGKFTRDLLLDPSSRDVNDVKHSVVAVASSGGKRDRAQAFIEENKCDASTQAYGTYEELVRDDNVQIVYVASPHTFHYENALLALNHGKAVCCEKPFTINAKQTKHLVEVAKAKHLFLMEAVWTRFFPVTLAIQKAIHQDRILGNLRRVHSDFGAHFPFDAKHRLYNPELGGGALLDLGLYPSTWVMLTLFSDPANERTPPSSIGSTMVKVPETGVDAITTAGVAFEKLHAMGTITANLRVKSDFSAYHTIIQGEQGDILVHGTPYRPEGYTIHLRTSDGETKSKDKHVFDIPGEGMFWEADACARSLRDGKIEQPLCSWQDSIATMTLLDTIRQQGGLRYPANLEAVQAAAE